MSWIVLNRPSHSIMCSSGRLPFSLMPMRSWTTWPMTWTENDALRLSDGHRVLHQTGCYDWFAPADSSIFQLKTMVCIGMLWNDMVWCCMHLCGDELAGFGLDSQQLTQEQVTDEFPQCKTSMCSSSGSIWFLNDSQIIRSIYPLAKQHVGQHHVFLALEPRWYLTCCWEEQTMIKTQLLREPRSKAGHQTLIHPQTIANH